jgi:hypothetical protein
MWRGHSCPRNAGNHHGCVFRFLNRDQFKTFLPAGLRYWHGDYRIRGVAGRCRRFGGCCQWVLDDACHASSGIQPLGFDSLALRGHSNNQKLIDNHNGVDTIEVAGIVQYH